MVAELRHKAPVSATVGVTSGEVAAANRLRRGLVLVNDSANKIYLAIGSPAVLNQGIFLSAEGGSYEINSTNLTFGAINAIADVASSNLTIQEAN